MTLIYEVYYVISENCQFIPSQFYSVLHMHKHMHAMYLLYDKFYYK